MCGVCVCCLCAVCALCVRCVCARCSGFLQSLPLDLRKNGSNHTQKQQGKHVNSVPSPKTCPYGQRKMPQGSPGDAKREHGRNKARKAPHMAQCHSMHERSLFRSTRKTQVAPQDHAWEHWNRKTPEPTEFPPTPYPITRTPPEVDVFSVSRRHMPSPHVSGYCRPSTSTSDEEDQTPRANRQLAAARECQRTIRNEIEIAKGPSE